MGILSEKVAFVTVGRVGHPADIAGLMAFLCGPDAGFMMGAYLLMDGGLQDARLQPDASDPR
jgi:NAD(P)-dependent dehydrogenase (short-subunit alcohol dehydrogenase family)